MGPVSKLKHREPNRLSLQIVQNAFPVRLSYQFDLFLELYAKFSQLLVYGACSFSWPQFHLFRSLCPNKKGRNLQSTGAPLHECDASSFDGRSSFNVLEATYHLFLFSKVTATLPFAAERSYQQNFIAQPIFSLTNEDADVSLIQI